MNRSPGPLSPVSIGGGSEWSGISKYQTLDTDSPYSPNPNNRGQLASPPISSGSNGTMNGMGFPRGGRESPNGPSPPASIARSSNGASLYNGTTMYAGSDSGKSRRDDQFETTLLEHYTALKRYLASSLRDEKGNPRPNKARDKLLRLSSVQFQELSTDVFDELLRRQAAGRKNSISISSENQGPPPFLLPKDTFHPKRNQARQKLSTLPPPRFRDLATDVFYELERRFPRFAGGEIPRTDSPASIRGPPSRIGTPVDGGPGFRPGSRGGPGRRRPSEASSISGYARSDSRAGSRQGIPNGGIGMTPSSPGGAPNDYGRPLAKTFQSNTIVPNKSTMVEDDDDQTGGEDNDDEDVFGLESAARTRESKRSEGASETDRKLIEGYQTQVAEMNEKLEGLQESLRKKDEEMNRALEGERTKASVAGNEKKEWTDLRLQLEDKLSDAQNLNESLQSELDRLRAEQSNTERDLRSQLDEFRANGTGNKNVGVGNEDLRRENEDLKSELLEQQEVTEEVRREAQTFLREMKILSERAGSSWEREDELSSQVNRLEEEVKDWRNRYARTKTQLRSLRASSIGLTIQQDVAQYTKDSGFTQADGLVKDVHVTKFQISIDELLRIARSEDPAKVVDYMKSVVICVRSITQDIDESSTGELSSEQLKLKSRVSATANNLITASKNFASARGLSPVSLLDAAASHLTTAVVELVRTVKIRPTPAGELEDDDDGNLPPVETPGFFPVRDSRQEIVAAPFLGLQNDRNSAVSSMYSPVNSPRQSGVSSSKDGWAARRPMSRNGQLPNSISQNGINGNVKSLSPAPMAFGIRTQESDVEDLKIYLEDQTALLVQTIQSLVSSIRSEAGITAISNELSAIAGVVGKVVGSTQTAMSSTGNAELRVQGEPIVKKLETCRQRLIDAGDKGKRIASSGDDSGKGEVEWRMWTQTLPPIAFEIARETKELVQRVDIIDGNGNGRKDSTSF